MAGPKTESFTSPWPVKTPRTGPAMSSAQIVRDVVISRQPVELYKILKFEAMVSSGGEAKAVIAEGAVYVNGVVETQKRKKIVAGDIIEFNGHKVQIQAVATDVEATSSIDPS